MIVEGRTVAGLRQFSARLELLISFVDENHARLELTRFGFVKARISDDDDFITHHREPCGGTIEADNARTRRRLDGSSRAGPEN